MKTIAALLVVALLAAMCMLGYLLARHTQQAAKSLVMQIVRALPRAYLVLQTETQIAVAKVDDGSPLWGVREGQATASRRTHYGLDMETLAPEDVVMSAGRVVVRLPEPAVFDSVVDPASVGIVAKRSGLQALRDMAAGRSIESELMVLLNQEAPAYAGDELEAQRKAFAERLNRHASDLFGPKGLEVEFK